MIDRGKSVPVVHDSSELSLKTFTAEGMATLQSVAVSFVTLQCEMNMLTENLRHVLDICCISFPPLESEQSMNDGNIINHDPVKYNSR